MDPLFAITAAVCTGSALLMVTRRNPVYAAIWLLICFLSVALVFLQLSASFLAAIHVLVYTGAILVLFLFVIMLLNLRENEFGDEYPLPLRLGGAAMSVLLFAVLAGSIWRDARLAEPLPTPPQGYGTVESVGWLLFTQYALPFELVSLLIIVAMLGAMVLAKKKPVPSE